MPDISIDISSLASIYSLNPDQVIELGTAVVRRIANATVRNIVSLAKKELRQTRNDYIESIVVNEGDGYAEIELIGFLPNAVEQGLSPFDMKSGFMKSPKAKKKIGGGWYITIPYRHGIPTTIGDSSGFSKSMPSDVYRAVSHLKPMESVRKSSLPSIGVSVRPIIKTDNKVYPEYVHKNDIYEGMMKINKRSGHHSHYITFRRVSDKSDSNSWIHTGISARNLFDRGLQSVDIGFEVDFARDEFFYKLGI